MSVMIGIAILVTITVTILVTVTITVMIPMLSSVIALVALGIAGCDRDVVRIKPGAIVTDLTGIIGVDGITGGIKTDFVMGDSFGLINGELETSIEGQLRADDLFGVRCALDQIISAINVPFGNQVGDDVPATLAHLLRSQLLGLIDQGEQGGEAAGCRWGFKISRHHTTRRGKS